MDPEDAFGFELSGGREACAAARRAVVAGDGALPGAVREDVLLLVTPTRLSREELGGWGLVLVDRIAARWGVRRGPARTCAWFEIEF